MSDVVAGWLLGLGSLEVTAAAFESWRPAGRPPHEPTEVVSEGLDPPGSHVAADKS